MPRHAQVCAHLTVGCLGLVRRIIHTSWLRVRFGQHLGSLVGHQRVVKESVAREKAKFEALVDNALSFLDKTEAASAPENTLASANPKAWQTGPGSIRTQSVYVAGALIACCWSCVC